MQHSRVRCCNLAMFYELIFLNVDLLYSQLFNKTKDKKEIVYISLHSVFALINSIKLFAERNIFVILPIILI